MLNAVPDPLDVLNRLFLVGRKAETEVLQTHNCFANPDRLCIIRNLRVYVLVYEDGICLGEQLLQQQLNSMKQRENCVLTTGVACLLEIEVHADPQ